MTIYLILQTWKCVKYLQKLATVVDAKFEPRQKMTPEKWSMLSSHNYKNFDEIILNTTFNN